MMKSNKKLPANDAGKRRYKKYKSTHFHSKYIPTFMSQKFKNSGKINPIKPSLYYVLNLFSAPIKARASKHQYYYCLPIELKSKQQEMSDQTTENTGAGVLLETGAGVLFESNLPHKDDCLITSNTDSCDSSTEKKVAGALCKQSDGMHFTSNLPHIGKQYDCVILSKTGNISCHTHIHIYLSLIHI